MPGCEIVILVVKGSQNPPIPKGWVWIGIEEDNGEWQRGVALCCGGCAGVMLAKAGAS
jgi:hypothetical protein